MSSESVLRQRLTAIFRQFQQEHRWVRLALWTWAIFAIALCAKVLVEGDRHSVYPAFVGSARDWMAREVMYDHEGYYYSPTFTVAFIPFTLVPDRIGQMLWGLASVGLFVWSMRAFYRDVLPRHWPKSMEAGLLLLTLIGSLRGIWSLQSNAVIMACILFAASAIVREGWWRAAWLLAAPIYIKVWPAIAAGLLAVHWPRRLISRGLAACGALACLPFLTALPATVIGYYHDWIMCLAFRQSTNRRFTGYRDSWTIWEMLVSPVDPKKYLVVQAISGLATLGWVLWLGFWPRANGPRRKEEVITFTLAAWSAWQLLFGPGTERLTYVIIAPFAAWAVLASYQEGRNLRLAIATFVTTFVFGAGGIERMLVRWIPWAPALQPIGIVLFAVWLTRHALRGDGWINHRMSIDELPAARERATYRAAA